MSYRSDHEAALMRVDALEAELARVRRETPSKPAPPKKRGGALTFVITAAAVTITLLLGKVAWVALASPPTAQAAMIKPAIEPAMLPNETRSLRACIADIAPVAGSVDETTTNPRHATGASPVSWVPLTGAGCRSEITAAAQSMTVPDDLRTIVQRWGTAEDVLAGTISLIVVYYENDPYALDGYATAGQLWREYHAARLARDSVLREVAQVLEADPTALDV
jgi:hypothetical protein